MVSELEEKLGKLENNIKVLESSENQSPGLVSDINSQIAVFDSLLEFYKLPVAITARYNKARMLYSKLFKNERVYYSTDRSIRINKIAQDAEHLVDMQDFINEHITNQSNGIDKLASNLLHSEIYIDTTLGELETHRSSLSKKMWIWRYLAVGIMTCGIFVIYKTFI